MKIAIGGDSAGRPLIEVIGKHLAGKPGIEVADLSPGADNSKEFYANTAERVAMAVAAGKFDRGILACGTGIGVAISANKVPGIRAAQTAHYRRKTVDVDRRQCGAAYDRAAHRRQIGLECGHAVERHAPVQVSHLDFREPHLQRLQ